MPRNPYSQAYMNASDISKQNIQQHNMNTTLHNTKPGACQGPWDAGIPQAGAPRKPQSSIALKHPWSYQLDMGFGILFSVVAQEGSTRRLLQQLWPYLPPYLSSKTPNPEPQAGPSNTKSMTPSTRNPNLKPETQTPSRFLIELLWISLREP